MKTFSLNTFQEQVDDVLIRHRSILDILTKLQESNAKMNRAVAKSATSCGCITLHVKKQEILEEVSYSELKGYMSDHTSGALCDVCREKVEQEIATNLFYVSALCNLFNINVEGVLQNHQGQLKTLGKYGLL
ncbi:conserved hypothetical protein [Alkaliphilus metalliredigens QYMF]|uniref:DUF1573 domain-containing protein n=1 Tax=Alkaliphilus metalliredigens (strain QYMF) TaxID=293826 RepID=A6TWL3_ALKMQ|nr:hypothetical protein [Alkaliphilus metalliredigens]ABR50581.1 conserved hypothetical protein [Alkaliphilus metalliredigens QYMF]